MSLRFHACQRKRTKSAKIMLSKREKKSAGTALFTQKCVNCYPVQTEDPENDTLSGGTSPYRKCVGVPPLLRGFRGRTALQWGVSGERGGMSPRALKVEERGLDSSTLANRVLQCTATVDRKCFLCNSTNEEYVIMCCQVATRPTSRGGVRHHSEERLNFHILAKLIVTKIVVVPIPTRLLRFFTLFYYSPHHPLLGQGRWKFERPWKQVQAHQ